MENKNPKEISLKELSKNLKSIFDKVTENKDQFIVEDDNGKKAIMIDFEEFMEFLFSVEHLFEDMHDYEELYDHDYNITPLLDKIYQQEEPEFLIHLVLHNYVDEELAHKFIDDLIDEEEFVTEIYEDPMFDQETIEDDFDPFLADFLNNLDDDLFELIIEKEATPDLIYKLAHGSITPNEFIEFLRDDSKKH